MKLYSRLVGHLLVLWVGVAVAGVPPGDDLAESPDGPEAVKVYFTETERIPPGSRNGDRLPGRGRR